VRVAVTGAAACVRREPLLEAALAASFTPQAVKGVQLSADDLTSDLHASASYRAAMIAAMAAKAVEQALSR
jgi:carbon-monoxide dehydrogenase medium subunit